MESAELIAILREVRERVAAGNGGRTLDLMPLVHARDAALGKVAAIGTVNPRPGGLVNSLVQGWKRLVARVLDWHVREQVEFNRHVVASLDAVIESLNDLGHRIEVAEELKDIRNHWAEWRAGWESRLQQNEIRFLRSVAELEGSFQHRVSVLDTGCREAMRGQHVEFMAALERHGAEIQQRLWADLERIRLEYERLIYSELKTIRQRAAVAAGRAGASPAAGRAGASPAPAQTTPEPAPQFPFDYGRFAERFRGTEEYVKTAQAIYDRLFAGRSTVLDLGCGRGEFLERMREIGVAARGIDSSPESVALCRHKGLDAEVADLFDYLAALPEASLGGIFCSQVVEHIPPERLPELIRLAAGRLKRGGVIAIETPNPECLAIFATHFYLDPTHQRPVPHALLAFYLEEFGVGNIEVRKLSPAVESIPSLRSLSEDFREAFFGGLDYAITGRKL